MRDATRISYDLFVVTPNAYYNLDVFVARIGTEPSETDGLHGRSGFTPLVDRGLTDDR